MKEAVSISIEIVSFFLDRMGEKNETSTT